MKTTEELANILASKRDINRYISENKEELSVPTFTEQLKSHMQMRNLKRSDILSHTLIYSRYGYEIFEGKKKPTRDKVLQLCLALHLSLVDSQHLLNSAGVGDLYPRSIRDSIIIHCIQTNKSVIECNELLYSHQESSLE